MLARDFFRERGERFRVDLIYALTRVVGTLSCSANAARNAGATALKFNAIELKGRV